MPGTSGDRTEHGRKITGTRLRKLVCSRDCGYPPLRVSRAAIDRGLPSCPCGGLLWPWDLDDLARATAAGHLSDEAYDAHPLVVEYQRKLTSVERGQHGHQRAGSDALIEPSAAAMLHVAELVRSGARANQLAAARGQLRTDPTTDDPIPF